MNKIADVVKSVIGSVELILEVVATLFGSILLGIVAAPIVIVAFVGIMLQIAVALAVPILILAGTVLLLKFIVVGLVSM